MSGQHTLRFYDEQLDHLLALVIEMGQLVNDMVRAARNSLRERRPAMVEDALNADRRINELDRRIEEEATAVLALQNPMAIDLRFVTSTLKIATMLERAGDLAKNVVKRSAELGSFVPGKTVEKLERMADIVSAMLDDALAAFKERDSARAIAVWKKDDEVDELYHQVFRSMQEEMAANAANVPSCTHIVFTAKNFERIADHTTNLAKSVYYVTSGKRADKAIIKEPPYGDTAEGSAAAH